MENRGDKIFLWIEEMHKTGRTVYAQTAWKTIAIKPNHNFLIRSQNGHCEVQKGKHWVSINYCKLSAR